MGAEVEFPRDTSGVEAAGVVKENSQSRSRWGKVLLWLALAASGASACSKGKSSPPKCIPGASVECACLGGAKSAQVCKDDGTFAQCACDAVPSPPPVVATQTTRTTPAASTSGAPAPPAEPEVDAGAAATEPRAPSKPPAAPPPRPASASKSKVDELLRQADAARAAMRWDEARARYAEVAQGKHQRAAGLLGLARIAFETRDVEAAVGYATKSLEAGGGDPAHLVLGHSYFKLRRYDDALRNYEAVLEHAPGNKEAERSAVMAQKKLEQSR